jgi:hypothetical protein
MARLSLRTKHRQWIIAHAALRGVRLCNEAPCVQHGTYAVKEQALPALCLEVKSKIISVRGEPPFTKDSQANCRRRPTRTQSSREPASTQTDLTPIRRVARAVLPPTESWAAS